MKGWWRREGSRKRQIAGGDVDGLILRRWGREMIKRCEGGVVRGC